MFKPLICTALVMASDITLAQDPGADRGARHAERHAQAQARFTAADRDANGRLGRLEAQAVGERMANNFDRMDANRDGALDKAELAAVRQKMGRAAEEMKAYGRATMKAHRAAREA